MRVGGSGAKPVAGAGTARQPEPEPSAVAAAGSTLNVQLTVRARGADADAEGALRKHRARHDDDGVVALQDLLGDAAGVGRREHADFDRSVRADQRWRSGWWPPPASWR